MSNQTNGRQLNFDTQLFAYTREHRPALTFMCIFDKNMFSELQKFRLVVRYIEQRRDRPGHAHWKRHLVFTKNEKQRVQLKRPHAI